MSLFVLSISLYNSLMWKWVSEVFSWKSCVLWVQDESCLWDTDSSFLSPRPWALPAAALKATLQFLATQLHPKNLAKRAAMGGTADGGMGHGAGSGKVQQQKQHLSSAAAPQLRAAFLGKVGQCKLPLPVGLVSEGERWSSCEEGKGCCSLGTISSHTDTHICINRNTAVEAGREWVGEKSERARDTQTQWGSGMLNTCFMA